MSSEDDILDELFEEDFYENKELSQIEWFHEQRSRPVYKYIYRDSGLSIASSNIAKSLGTNERAKVKSLLSVLAINLFQRHLTTEGEGSIGVFTANSENSDTNSPQYKALGVTGKTLKKYLDLLKAEGFIKVKAGFPGHSTKVKATQKFVTLMESAGIDLKYLGVPPQALLRFWGPNPKGKKGHITFGFDQLFYHESLPMLEKYHELLQQTDISVAGSPIYSDEKLFSRIFINGSYQHDGRIYGGIWQRLAGDARHFLELNGDRTVEIDISSSHALIAYSGKGMDLTDMKSFTDFDPYVVTHGGYKSYSREIGKNAFVVALNSKDESQASKALEYKFKKTKKEELKNEWEKLNNGGVKTLHIIRQVIDHNKPISEYFLKRAWHAFHYLESEILVRVVEAFVEKGKPILTVFDSYIVQEKEEFFLEQELQKACFDVLGIQFKYTDYLYKKKPSPRKPVSFAKNNLKQTRLGDWDKLGKHK